MKRVTGIGGVFFKSRDVAALREWYRAPLGIDIQEWGGFAFRWAGADHPGGTGSTIWSVFDAESACFAPSQAAFMVNYRVDDLRALLAALRSEGREVDAKVEESEFGKFGWVVDPDGHRVELCQPRAMMRPGPRPASTS